MAYIKHTLTRNTDASKQNIENAWYVRNTTIHKDMVIPFITETLHVDTMHSNSEKVFHVHFFIFFTHPNIVFLIPDNLKKIQKY